MASACSLHEPLPQITTECRCCRSIITLAAAVKCSSPSLATCVFRPVMYEGVQRVRAVTGVCQARQLFIVRVTWKFLISLQRFFLQCRAGHTNSSSHEFLSLVGHPLALVLPQVLVAPPPRATNPEEAILRNHRSEGLLSTGSSVASGLSMIEIGGTAACIGRFRPVFRATA